MYSLFIILLDNCSYSINAKKLLDSNKIRYTFLNIYYSDMDKFITDEIDTFPQIYLCKTGDNGTQLLGGYDDLFDFRDYNLDG